MVNARELRIGNAIWDQRRGKIKWVNHRVINDLESHPNPLEYTGIPLTEEILLKRCCCYQGEDKEMWRNPQGVWITRIAPNPLFIDEFFIEGFKRGHTIKYLHQFQNATFVLTGEELTYAL